MANNPLDELVQTSSNPVTDQPVSASVDNPSLSPMLSTTPSVPTPSSTISSTPSPAAPLDNPLDQLISSAASTEPDAETEVKIANPVNAQPFQAASQAQMPLTNPKPMNPSPTQSAHSPASPTNITTPNPLDSLISDDSSQKPIESHSALDQLVGSASEEKVKSTLTDVSATPILPMSPSPIQNSPGIMENPISLGLANRPTAIPSIPEHDIAPMSPALSQSSPSITSVAPASTIPSAAIKPAAVATIRADQAPTLSKKELEEKAKKLLKDSPPKGKSSKKPWILGLLTLLIVVGAAGGGLFAYRFANPETTDQRSQAAGICCLGGECNDGTTFGGDPSAWHSSCDVRAEDFCSQNNRGGVKRNDGACTGSEPNTCNDNTPADSCWVFVCPNGCGGDGNETSCDGDEPGATKRTTSCDDASLGNNECGQIDYVKNNQYCGVKDVQCGTDCIPNPIPTIAPTAPAPSVTTPPQEPTLTPAPTQTPLSCNSLCSSSSTCQSVNNAYYCHREHDASAWVERTSDIQTAESGAITCFSSSDELSNGNGYIQQHVVRNGKIWSRNNLTGSWTAWANATGNVVIPGTEVITGFSTFMTKEGNIQQHVVKGGKIWFRTNESGSWQATWQDVTSNVISVGEGEITGFNTYLKDNIYQVQFLVRGNEVYRRDSRTGWSEWEKVTPLLNQTGTGNITCYSGHDKQDGEVQRLARGGKLWEYAGDWFGGTCRLASNPTSQTCAPAPTPEALACTSLTKAPPAPKLGEVVTFTCAAAPAPVAKYEFRYKVANGNYASLTPETANPNTAKLTVTSSGAHKVECRACDDAAATSCTTWGLAK